MSRSSGNFTVRRATPADKAAVLDIRAGAFGGYDYLPAYYDHFMADTNRESFVCELDDKVVGFLAINIVDGGRAYLAQGGRVSEEAEGKGVFRLLVDHCRARAREIGCVRELMTTNHMNQHIHTDSYKAEKTTIMKKSMLSFLFDESAQQNARQLLQTGTQGDEIQPLEEADCYPLFKNPEVTSYLFPAGWIMLDWVLLKPEEVNIARLKGRNTRFVSDVAVKPEELSGLISSQTQFPCYGFGTICIVDVFGSDVKALEKHVRHHIAVAVGIDGNFGMCFNVDESMTEEIIGQLRSFGVDPLRWHKDIGEDGLAWALGFETIL